MRESISEYIYILYRRLKAFTGYCLYFLFSFIPIDNNKIVLMSFEGKQGYSCNPKAIAEELLSRNLNRPSHSQYKLVWLVNDITKSFPEEIRIAKNNMWNRAYHLSTAKTWIDNHRKPLETRKRGNQLYIGTWHGAIGFKPVGKLRGSAFPKIAYLVSKHDSEMVDYFLSNSRWCTEMYRKAFFYEGKVLKTGSPRCDVYRHREEVREQIRHEFNLPLQSKILLYAPTFRSGNQKTSSLKGKSGNINMNFEQLTNTLQAKFGGEWYIFVRHHPILTGIIEPYSNKEEHHMNVIDVTVRDDVYDVLAASEAFISDYSSIVFDAATMRIPVFIYADDIQDYVRDRGELLWDMSELPFDTAYSNEQLLYNIQEFNEDEYPYALEQFFNRVGLLEDGYASKRVVDLIDETVQGKV